jgi:hypothetical protein
VLVDVLDQRSVEGFIGTDDSGDVPGVDQHVLGEGIDHVSVGRWAHGCGDLDVEAAGVVDRRCQLVADR